MQIPGNVPRGRGRGGGGELGVAGRGGVGRGAAGPKLLI